MKWLTVLCCVMCAIQCYAMSSDEIEDFSNFLEQTSHLDEVLKKGGSPEDTDEDEQVSDHAWEESGKFEGDLVLNARQRRVIVEDVAEGLSRNGLNDITKRWPNNEVIYYIQREHFSGDQIQAIVDGINDLAQASCVTFRPYRRGDRDAVVIQGSRRGCFSQVGYQGGYQVLNLSGRHPVGRGCFRHGTVVHEMLHTLGFYHMQSSPDRDDYINVLWHNILQPARHNFRKYNSFSVSDFGVGYDYDSVLHYSRRAFSNNGQDTIVPKQSGVSIGQRIGLSDKDAQKLNKMYCDANSDQHEAEEKHPQKPIVKKKSAKNKPFEGHGIGYHQGKTVVIKLPAVETYKVPDTPIFHTFDYFSKTPKILSPTSLAEGKQLVKLYKPHPKDNVEAPKTYLIEHNISRAKVDDISNKSLFENESTPHDGKHETINTMKINDTNQHSLDEKIISKGASQSLKNTVNDAFERLGQIIKTHVYPSQEPNVDIYRPNVDLTVIGFKEHNVPPSSETETEKSNHEKNFIPKSAEEFVRGLQLPYSLQEKSKLLSDELDAVKLLPLNLDGKVAAESHKPSYTYKVKEDEYSPSQSALIDAEDPKHIFSGSYTDKESRLEDFDFKGHHGFYGKIVPLSEEPYKHRLFKNIFDKYYRPDENNSFVRENLKASDQSEPEYQQSKYSLTSSVPTRKAYSLIGVLVPFSPYESHYIPKDRSFKYRKTYDGDR